LETKSQRAKEEEKRKRKEQDEAFLRAFKQKYGTPPPDSPSRERLWGAAAALIM
jgi:hypothetical protein